MTTPIPQTFDNVRARARMRKARMTLALGHWCSALLIAIIFEGALAGDIENQDVMKTIRG